MAPSSTSMLLITLIGPIPADRFAARWLELAKRDDAVRSYMSLMRVADVVQGTKPGQQLSKASLLPAVSKKPWWKFW
jgi:hypothetical protein